MKKEIMLVIIGFLLVNNISAQLAISCGYNVSEGWESIPIVISKSYGNHTGNIGFAIGKNAMLIYDHNNVFRRQLYGSSFMQRLSLHLGYEYNFKSISNSWYPSIVSNLIASHAPARSRTFLPMGYDTDGNIIYNMIDIYSQPMSMFEGYLGVKLSFMLSPKLYFHQTIGAGGFVVTGFEGSLSGTDGDVGFIFSWAISYQIFSSK